MPCFRGSCRTLIFAGVVVGFSKLLVAAEPAAEAPPKFSDEQVRFFEKEVQPILTQHCLKCHGGEKDIQGEFRLTSRGAVLIGGESGEPAVLLDKPEESPLVKAINHRGLEMPPKKKLAASEIEILTKWVKSGLPWTPGQEGPIVRPKKKNVITAEDRVYWAYQSVKVVEPPTVKNKAWVRNPIDAFILQKLEQKELSPAAPAERVALVRRAYYDLTGLPPSAAEVDAFVQDKSTEAFERLIDKLLASPQYGEKWGRHWLDLVRYAESNGYERDSAKPFAWRYRDYVISAFNQDKPYSDFIREQLAGDELDKVTNESLIATGYYRLGIWDDEPADKPLAKLDVLDGIVSTTSSAFLGMSVGCARCHDHKKDPIPQRDYYRLLAVFHDITDMNGKNTKMVASDEERTRDDKQNKQKAAREASLHQEIYQLEQQFALALREKKGLQATTLPKSDLDDVQFKFYRDTWDKLPNFAGLKHETEGPIANNYFSLAPASRTEAIGFVFTGRLIVPADGEYTFAVESTDGSRLTIDGRTIWEQPGQGRQRGTVKANLKMGMVPIQVDYFNRYDKPVLRIKWSGPGFAERWLTPNTEKPAVAATVLLPDARTQPQSWKYTTVEPAADWTSIGFDDNTWKKGASGFGNPGTPGATVRTPWSTNAIWLRKTFLVDELPKQLTLDIHHDEDVEVCLNGKLVYAAKGFLKSYTQVPLPVTAVQALQKGNNLIAVRCSQTGGGQYIDVGLRSGEARVELVDLIREHGATALDQKSVDKLAALQKELATSREDLKSAPGTEIMCVEESGRTATHVLLRGNPAAQGDVVKAGPPAVLTSDDGKLVTFDAKPAGKSGKRRALAEWLVSPENPLTARVFVNRLWQHHFGQGLATSPNEFGKLGEAPTHPELLAWLAKDFLQGGWHVKRMHRLIMLSNAYQMSSRLNEAAFKVDGGNTLLWRFPMRRLTAEEVRDSMLQVSGELNLKGGGPSVYPIIPREVLAGQSVPGAGWGKSTPLEAARRSVYVHVKRSLLVPVLSQHDQADTDSSCPVRYTTTVPTQALGMLNGEFTHEQAAAFAARLTKQAPGNLQEQIRLAIRLTCARQPNEAEIQRDAKFVGSLRDKYQLDERGALNKYCLLILNTNEFLYLD